MDSGAQVLEGFLNAFDAQKTLAEKAITQLSDEQLRTALDENTNSVCVIMKHVAGNLRSRFTDFLHTDGEKSWRDRDGEFVDTFADRAEIMRTWEEGWAVLFDTLSKLEPGHLGWSVTIRGEVHDVPEALARALAHVGYHTGQIVLISRILRKNDWNTITIARGQSRAFNAKLGFDAAAMERTDFGDEPT
jgi:hypothetical protein